MTDILRELLRSAHQTLDEMDERLDQMQRREELLHAKIAHLKMEIEELTKPPEDDEWRELIALAYWDGGDGSTRINRITAEYNRARSEHAEARRQAESYRQTSEVLLGRSIPASEGWLEFVLCLMRRITDYQTGSCSTHAKG
jgi:hypothetical protein